MIDKPGPELNMFIHQKLFGVDLTGYEMISNHTASAHKHGLRFNENIPGYSTTWNGMQLVVEEMQRRGYQILLTTTADKRWKAVVFNGYTRGHVYAEGFGDTAPHATALATLKALEE